MAELATIARPYADALYKSVGGSDARALNSQLGALAAFAGAPACPRWLSRAHLAVAVLDLLEPDEKRAIEMRNDAIFAKLLERLDSRVRPAVAGDGGQDGSRHDDRPVAGGDRRLPQPAPPRTRGGPRPRAAVRIASARCRGRRSWG